LGLAVVALLVAGVVAYYHDATPGEAASAELELCRRFMALKNDHDPAANDLLGPTRPAPQEAVSQEEADRLDADAFLRGEFRVADVRPAGTAEGNRFLLVMKGSGVGDVLRVRSGDKVDRVQRVVRDPALLVEVRDGKIYGVKSQLPPV
jgi:hypothetical protein